MVRSNNAKLIIIFFIFMMAPLGFVTYIPALGMLAKELHTSSDTMALTLSYYFLGVALSQLVYGTLSDKIGRKKTILLGYALFLIGGILCAFAQTIEQFVFCRIIQGLGIGCDASIGTAIIKDIYAKKEKLFFGMMSFSETAFSFSALVFPFIGGYIAYLLGWRAIFIFMSACTLILILGIMFFLEETNSPKENKNDLTVKKYIKMLLDYRYLAVLCALSIVGASFPIFQILGSQLFVRLSCNSVTIGNALAITGTTATLGCITNIFFLRKFKVKTSTYIFLAIFLLSSTSTLIMAHLQILNFYAVLIPSAFLFFAVTPLYSNLMGSAILKHPKHAGTCGGHIGFSSYLSGAIITWLISAILVKDLYQLGFVLSAQFVLIAVLYFSSRERAVR